MPVGGWESHVEGSSRSMPWRSCSSRHITSRIRSAASAPKAPRRVTMPSRSNSAALRPGQHLAMIAPPTRRAAAGFGERSVLLSTGDQPVRAAAAATAGAGVAAVMGATVPPGAAVVVVGAAVVVVVSAATTVTAPDMPWPFGPPCTRQ